MWLDECDGEVELDLPHGQPPLEWVEWVELWWSLPVEREPLLDSPQVQVVY